MKNNEPKHPKPKLPPSKLSFIDRINKQQLLRENENAKNNKIEPCVFEKSSPSYSHTDIDGNIFHFKMLNKKEHLHRTNGPAIIYANGTKEWWLNGLRHRDNGPAVEFTDGDQQWWVKGRLHRDDGPAWVYGDGSKPEYYLDGNLYTASAYKVEVEAAKGLAIVDNLMEIEKHKITKHKPLSKSKPKPVAVIPKPKPVRKVTPPTTVRSILSLDD